MFFNYKIEIFILHFTKFCPRDNVERGGILIW